MLKPKVIFSLLVAGLLYWGWYESHQPNHLPIRRVRIQGSYTHVVPQDIQEASQPYVNGNFFEIDVRAIKHQLQALPWVKSVSVMRVWPDTLNIRIDEQEPVAFWGSDGLLNESGELFRPAKLVDLANDPLPRLAGPDGQHQWVWQQYLALQAILQPRGLQIKTLELDERQSWRMQLDNGMTLLLGRNDTEKRLKRFVKVYNRAFGSHSDDAKSIDLRYTNGMSVTWRT